jgi:restriction endonuclease Mrr
MFTPISFDARLICRTAAATTRYAIGGLLFANEIRDIKLILIDGTRPAEFMAQHELSVWVKSTYRISAVDHDFFESF